MNRKIGKLKAWQWLAIGSVAGFILYEVSKNKKPKGETEGAGLAASVPNPIPQGGGSGGGEGLGGIAPGAPGEPGQPGAQGSPGEPAPIQSLTGIENNLAHLEAVIASQNNPLTTATRAPAHSPAKKFPQKNSKGESYRTEKKNGKTVHVYSNGRRVTVGGARPHRRTANAKHQAQKHSRQRAHPPNPQHHPSHAAPVAAHQHGRPVPIHHRTVKPARKPVRQPTRKRKR